MATFDDRSQVEKRSPLPFDVTVERLSRAISGAGLHVFAVIDHAQNARNAGLSMPPSTVLIYGKAEGGTPIMLAHPQSALDLPLRVLIREDRGETMVAFSPIMLVLGPSGVPASLATKLEPAQALLFKALET